MPTMPAPLPDAPLPVLGHLPSRWEPPADTTHPITTHAGMALPATLLYLAPPPLEIGPVRTAFSTISAEKGIEAKALKRIWGVLGGVVLGAIVVLGIGLKIGFRDISPIALGIGGILGGVIGFFTSKPDYFTSYVGEHGIAHFKYGSRSNPIAKAQMFPFERGTVLNVQQTRNYYNGVYTGTTYNYTWKDAANKPIHTITGTHRSKEGTPPPEDPYYFAISAERLWSLYMLPLCQQRLAQGESIAFPVQGKGVLRISARGLALEFGGKIEEIAPEEIGDMGIRNGQITIARTDARKGFLGIGKDGIYTFPYASLGNARLFVALLAMILGRKEPEGTGNVSADTPTASPTNR